MGGPLIQLLLEKEVSRVVAADADQATVEGLSSELSDPRLEARVAGPGDTSILAEECDLLAPCATGAILNARTIPAIRARF